MAQPKHFIPDNQPQTSVAANLLPCKVHYDGPVSANQSHWMTSNSTTAKDGMQTAYFRGRELHGQAIQLPKDHRGLLVQKQCDQSTNGTTEPGRPVNELDERSPDEGERLQTLGEFQGFIVWTQESNVDASSDPYARSVDELIQASQKIHAFSGK